MAKNPVGRPKKLQRDKKVGLRFSVVQKNAKQFIKEIEAILVKYDAKQITEFEQQQA